MLTYIIYLPRPKWDLSFIQQLMKHTVERKLRRDFQTEEKTFGRAVSRFIFILFSVFAVVAITNTLAEYALASGNNHNADPNGDVLGASTQSADQIMHNGRVPKTDFIPKPISIKYKGKTLQVLTHAVTVEDAFLELRLEFTENMEVFPALDTNLTPYAQIVVDEFTYATKTEIEEIPFESISVKDDNVEIDTTAVVQTGKPGEKEVTYQYAYKNGILEGKTAIKEAVLSQPQDEIIAIGTKKVFRTITIGSDTFDYWKKRHMWGTSYDSNCTGCSGYTATGMKLKKGICAVDPSVIPLFTHLYIPGYGFCIAGDVGGGVKGEKIDLGYDDLSKYAGEWSARWTDVYILD